MKTSSFAFVGPGRISIARLAPRHHPRGYRIYKPLAPGPWFNSVDEAEYRQRFEREILAPLDPQAAWRHLHNLAAGAEPVLLCYERPEDLASGKTFCHRQIVADWLERTLRHQVQELE